MWMYPGPSCLDRSFSAELDNAEIDIRILRILVLRAHRNFGPSPIPLREGDIIPWVSPLDLGSARFVPTSTLPNVCCLYAQGHGCVPSDPWGSLCPRMWRGGRPSVPTMEGSVHGSGGGGLGMLPGQL
jgi:hypothetical protein